MSGMNDRKPSGAKAQLDDIAKRIIELLQDDGRLSYSAIAKQVDLSEAAVRHRVQKLIETGVMQIVAVTDPAGSTFSQSSWLRATTSCSTSSRGRSARLTGC